MRWNRNSEGISPWLFFTCLVVGAFVGQAINYHVSNRAVADNCPCPNGPPVVQETAPPALASKVCDCGEDCDCCQGCCSLTIKVKASKSDPCCGKH